VRGNTPGQIADKYDDYAFDAEKSGDISNSYNYSQHAEHWRRVENYNDTETT
jgi:hypothetical protein